MKTILALLVAFVSGLALAKTYEVTPATLSSLMDEIVADRKAAAQATGVKNPVWDDEVVFQRGVYRCGELKCRDHRSRALLPFVVDSGRLVLRGATGDRDEVVFSGQGVNECRLFAFGGCGRVEMRDLTIENFRLTNRLEGAALWFDVGRTTNLVRNCAFRACDTQGSGGACYGGNYRGCVFEGNSASCGGAYAAGLWRSLSGTAENCVFRGNQARATGGACYGGQFTNCLFEANSCPTGSCSAIAACYPRQSAVGCVFRGNQAPVRNSFNSRWVAAGTVYQLESWPRGVCDNVFEDNGHGVSGYRGPRAAFNETRVRPGESIPAAIEWLRRNREVGARATLTLLAGVHAITNRIDLNGLDDNLTIRAERPGAVTLAGGWCFTGKDFRKSETHPGLLEIEVPENLRTNFWNRFDRREYPVLSVDMAVMIPGRWPQQGRYFFGAASNIVQKATKGGTNSLYRTFTGRELTWKWDDADIWIWGENGCAFSKGFARANGIDPVTQAVDFGKFNLDGNAHFYFINVLEETDEPGEWCYERKTGKLYLCPPKGFNDKSICALSSLNTEMFRVYANGVSFEGLNFTAKNGGNYAIDLIEGVSNRVVGCRFGALGQHAVRVNGRFSEVRSCDFSDILYAAVLVEGGDAPTLSYASNRVENCTFRNCCFAQNGCHSPSLCVSGCGNTLAHNQVWDSISQGIGIGGQENLVEYNRLWNVTTDNGDSNSMGNGGTCSGYGNVIRYNDVAGSPGYTHGIYCDDFSCGVIIYGNVVHDVSQWGIFLGGGRDHVISNNVITACWGGVHTDNRGQFWPAWRDKQLVWSDVCKMFDLPKSAFAKKYPKLCRWWDESENGKQLCAPIGLEISNNVFIDLPGYTSLAFVALDRGFPESANWATNNLAVRPVGVRPGNYDLAESDAAKAPTNTVSGGVGADVLRRYFPVRVLDGTPEEPVDLGFVKLPSPKFDLSDCMFMREGWIDWTKFNAARRTDRFDNLKYDKCDFNLKSGARIFKEIPGFAPIPWDKIGLYKDEWRKSL